MLTNDPITNQLDRLYARCNTPRHEQRIQARWDVYPALQGRTLDDIRHCLYDGHSPDHNPVLAALLRAHRAGDPDATTILLIALRPIVWSIIPNARNRAHALANAWAAVAVRLATSDPDDVETHPRPFLATLHGRLRRDQYKFHLTDQDTPHLPFYDHDLLTAADHVEDHAVARCTLAAIVTGLRHGDIDRDDWQQLVHHRINHPRHGTGGTRGDVTRTGSRVARLVGHAA